MVPAKNRVRKPICIVGMGESARHVPWNEAWEFWGMPWDPMAVRMTRLFEMHDWRLIQRGLLQWGGPEYIKRLIELGQYTPIYMQEKHEFIPKSITYPLELAIDAIGVDYFGSSLAYMLALAAFEMPSAVFLYGIDLSRDKYRHQRPNLEFLIGVLVGSGVPINYENCEGDLMTMRQADHWGELGVIFPERYGYLAELEV